MEKHIVYTTSGTCSTLIEVTGENGRVKRVRFTGGCNGNLKGIAALVEGMTYEEVTARLRGITCKEKPTSCPDQLAQAVEQLAATPD